MRQTFFVDNNLAAAVTMMEETQGVLRAHGLTPRSLFIAELVLEEMLTNTIKYAYDDEGPHRIEVLVEIQNETVSLQFIDDGHFFDPSRAPAPLPVVSLAMRAKGGCGISLVRKLVDHFEYRREGERNFLRIGFPATASGPIAAR